LKRGQKRGWKLLHRYHDDGWQATLDSEQTKPSSCCCGSYVCWSLRAIVSGRLVRFLVLDTEDAKSVRAIQHRATKHICASRIFEPAPIRRCSRPPWYDRNDKMSDL
jgi:hypothetical protein